MVLKLSPNIQRRGDEDLVKDLQHQHGCLELRIYEALPAWSRTICGRTYSVPAKTPWVRTLNLGSVRVWLMKLTLQKMSLNQASQRATPTLLYHRFRLLL